jgi:hypothetical protein
MSFDDFPDDWILRVVGSREDTENMVNRPQRTANVVHFAGWINYYAMADELTFYNDEYDDVVPVQPEPKPRRRPTTETEGEYHQRVIEWEARKPRKPEVTKPGNSMRASYYTEKILPIYCDAVNKLRSQSDQLRLHLHSEVRYNWYLQEDNDPSHGTKNPDSLPYQFKVKRGVLFYKHPPNSPDLNPIEGIWNIIKQRVKQYLETVHTIDNLKAALQAEWKQVKQEMVQERVAELPERLEQVFQHPRVRVKTALW